MASLRVLIVEDDGLVLDTLVEMTRLLGHQPFGCTRATIAKDFLRDKEFDLLLIDYQLPGMSGLELANLIKDNHAMKVVMISGYPAPVDLASDVTWLQKPFAAKDYEMLLAEIAPQP